MALSFYLYHKGLDSALLKPLKIDQTGLTLEWTRPAGYYEALQFICNHHVPLDISNLTNINVLTFQLPYVDVTLTYTFAKNLLFPGSNITCKIVTFETNLPPIYSNFESALIST